MPCAPLVIIAIRKIVMFYLSSPEAMYLRNIITVLRLIGQIMIAYWRNYFAVRKIIINAIRKMIMLYLSSPKVMYLTNPDHNYFATFLSDNFVAEAASQPRC